MGLQKTRGNVIGHFEFSRFFDNGSFMFSQSHNDDFPGGQNTPHTHRDCVMGYVVFAKKATRSIPPGHGVQIHQARQTVAGTSRFVETNMPRTSNPQ